VFDVTLLLVLFCLLALVAEPALLARGLTAPSAIAVDGQTVFVTESSSYFFRTFSKRVPAKGLPPAAGSLQIECTHPSQMLLDGSTLYCLDAEYGTVAARPKGAGRPSKLATFTQGYRNPGYLASDREAIYATHQLFHTITRVAKSGGAKKTLYTDPEQGGPGPIAVDDRSIYVHRARDGSLVRLSKKGGEPSVLARGEGRAFALALDATHAYWGEYDGGRVLRVAKDGSQPLEVLAEGQDGPRGVAVDRTHVYWVAAIDGSLWRVDKAHQSPPEVLARGLDHPIAIALDDAAIYVITAGDGGDLKGAAFRVEKR